MSSPLDESKSQSALPRGRGERVLFVDDEASLCTAGGMMLDRLGYRTTTHTSPAEALERFRREPESFDLLVTDLPGMSGVELAQGVLLLRPELPIVLVSGFGGRWTPENVREIGITDLVSKPLSLLALASAVRRALDLTTGPPA
jgi:DNA-binding NtrC family response regulator